MTKAPPTEPVKAPPQGAGMPDYLKEAFLFRWNLLFFGGGLAAAALTPLAPVLLPLVGAGELMYLTGLISIPRFRAAIDAKAHAGRQGHPATPASPPVSLVTMLNGLPADSRTRFERLHARCLEMRGIAAAIPAAEFVVIPHSGHMTPLENPTAFDTAIERFLARVESTS